MFSFLLWGHRASCPAPAYPCTCEKYLYLFTGVLAFAAGSGEGVVGYFGSALVFSDAPHSFIDGFADFGGILILASSSAWLIRHNQKIFAALLALAIIFIARDVYNRVLEERAVMPLAAFAAVTVATFIDALRWRMLAQAERLAHSQLRRGLVAHVKSDFWHGVIGMSVMTAAVAASLLGIAPAYIRWTDIILSVGLIGYMSLLTIGLWRGNKHSH